MKKQVIIGGIIAASLLFSFIGSAANNPQSSSSNVTESVNKTTPAKAAEKVTPTCDGTTITNNCIIDNISYSTYIYHSAVAEKSHIETITTYEQKITSTCTLCEDGTYSPSCATGRGACSHHGGVAQWNAPRYSSVPVSSTKKIIDTPAAEAYYEKVIR